MRVAIIRAYSVAEKLTIELGDEINVVRCTFSNCITTNREPLAHRLKIVSRVPPSCDVTIVDGPKTSMNWPGVLNPALRRAISHVEPCIAHLNSTPTSRHGVGGAGRCSWPPSQRFGLVT